MGSPFFTKFTGTTPAAPGSAILGTISPDITNTPPSGQVAQLNRYESLALLCTRQGAIGGTLDIFLQVSLDDGLTWTDIGHWAQLVAAAAQVTDLVTISRYQSSTTPTVTGDAVLGPAGSSTFINGEFTNRMRLKAVAGSGTTAGAAFSVRFFFNSISDHNF